MSNKPIVSVQRNKIQMAIWEFIGKQGEKNISYSFQKVRYNQQTKKNEYSTFFTKTDLQDIQVFISYLQNKEITNKINDSIKKNKQQNQASDLQQSQYQQSGKQFLDKHKEDQDNLHFNPNEDDSDVPF